MSQKLPVKETLTPQEQVAKNLIQMVNLKSHVDECMAQLQKDVDFVVNAENLPHKTILQYHRSMFDTSQALNWLITLIDQKEKFNDQHKSKIVET